MPLRFVNRASQTGVVTEDLGFPYIRISCGAAGTAEPGMRTFAEVTELIAGDTVPLLIKKDDANLLVAICSWSAWNTRFGVQIPEYYIGSIELNDPVIVSCVLSAKSMEPRLDKIISEYDSALTIDAIHSGTLLQCRNSTTLTISLGDFSNGWYVKVLREGTGSVVFTAINGCSINLNYEADITLVDRWTSAFICSDGSNWTVIKNA